MCAAKWIKERKDFEMSASNKKEHPDDEQQDIADD